MEDSRENFYEGAFLSMLFKKLQRLLDQVFYLIRLIMIKLFILSTSRWLTELEDSDSQCEADVLEFNIGCKVKWVHCVIEDSYSEEVSRISAISSLYAKKN